MPLVKEEGGEKGGEEWERKVKEGRGEEGRREKGRGGRGGDKRCK